MASVLCPWCANILHPEFDHGSRFVCCPRCLNWLAIKAYPVRTTEYVARRTDYHPTQEELE